MPEETCRCRRVVTQTLVAFILAQSALAQQTVPDASSEWRDVSGQLKPGTHEEVLLTDGSKVSGTLVRTAGEVLEIQRRTRFPVPSTQVPFDRVSMIRQGSSDSLVNGAVLGLVVGFGGTLAGIGIYAAAACGGCHWDPAWYPYAWSAALGGVGAGVGAGLDALKVSGLRLIYRRRTAATPTVRAMPMIGRARRGVLLAVDF